MSSRDRIKSTLMKLVGSDNYVDDPGHLKAYITGHAPGTETLPLCAVKPKNSAQVVSIVNAAADAGAKLIAFSSQPPRLRGDAPLSPESLSVAVDLSEMRQIVRINHRNKVALIEPGVTFGELQTAARFMNLRPILPLLPRSTKSVIASNLDREPITAPKFHWDMTDPMMCLGMVFGTGEEYVTEGAAGQVGDIPDDDMADRDTSSDQTDFLRLMQGELGTMGIVMWASIKLELIPVARKQYFVTAPEIEPLVGFLSAMTMRHLGDEMFILNSLALAGALKNDPRKIDLSASQQAPWNLFFRVGGYEYIPHILVDELEEQIKEIAAGWSLELKSSVPGIDAGDFSKMIDNTENESYWKRNYKGGFREIFFITTLDQVGNYIKITKAEAQKFNIPFDKIGIYVQPLQQGRACHLEFIVPYDPRDVADTKLAKEFFIAASENLARSGALFGRLNGPWSEIMKSSCPDAFEAVDKVKNIVDPHRVFHSRKTPV